LEIPVLAQELAVYPVDVDVEIDGQLIAAHTLAVLTPGQVASIRSTTAARLMILGGDALDGRRHMWWNFVSSRKERIVQAAQDWEDQRMGSIDGETEFIPLPENRFLAS
ncbi:MAG: pirin family protein, partial [Rhodoferax sp.]|nr:pirin family protein [Rhodoferax sp.]